MIKKLFLISLLMLFLIAIPSCKLPTTPDNPTYDGFSCDLLYERVLPIVDSSAPDTSGIMTIFHSEFGGKNSSNLIVIEEGKKWQTEAYFEFSKIEYGISIIDMKVTGDYEAVGWKISIRFKGNSEWTVLTCVEVKMEGTKGHWAKVIVQKSGFQHPCSN